MTQAQAAKKYSPENVIEKWGNLKSQIYAMSPEGDFSQLLKFVDDPKDTVVALDFDQTITIKVSGVDLAFHKNNRTQTTRRQCEAAEPPLTL